MERLNGSSQSGRKPGAEADTLEERRDVPRVERFGWARYASGDADGQGLVTNLSRLGAMVENCSELLDPGAKLSLRLKPAGGFETLSLEAEVVRATESGFAVQWSDAGEDVLALLDQVIEAALANA